MSHFILCFQILSQLLSFQFGLHHIAAVYPSQLVHLLNFFYFQPCKVVLQYITFTISIWLHQSQCTTLQKAITSWLNALSMEWLCISWLSQKFQYFLQFVWKMQGRTHTVFGKQIKIRKCPKEWRSISQTTTLTITLHHQLQPCKYPDNACAWKVVNQVGQPIIFTNVVHYKAKLEYQL